MKIFRNEGKYRIYLICVSLFSAILAYKAICNGIEVNIYNIYSMAIGDILVMGFMIPVVSLLIIKIVNDAMKGNILLAQNTRRSWWENINKRLLKNSFSSAWIVVLPVFLLFNIMVGKVRTFGECLYELCLVVSYFTFFYFLGLCIVIIKIRFHSSILAFCLVLFVSYLPNIIGYLYSHAGVPTISGILNISYALNKNNFYLIYFWKLILIMALLLFVLNEIGEIMMKKIDIFWEM